MFPDLEQVVVELVVKLFSEVQPEVQAGIQMARAQSIRNGTCMSEVSGLRYQVSGMRSQVSGIRNQGSGLRSQVSGLRSQVSGCCRGEGDSLAICPSYQWGSLIQNSRSPS